MKTRVIAKILAVLATLSLPTIMIPKNEPTGDLIQMGTYIATDKLAESERFYTALFGREPVIKLEKFIAYDIAGGIFAIADRAAYAPASVPGAGSVPYIHSTDLAAVRARIETATNKTAPEIINEPGIQLLKIADPNGQLLEFFTFTGG